MKTKEQRVPSKAAIAVPGLGYLRDGHYINGLALVGYVAVLAWAAISGLPRLGALLFPPPTAGGFQLHNWIGLAAAAAAAAGCWTMAWRHEHPRRRDGEARSSWHDFKRQFAKNRVGVLGMHLVLLLLLIALLTPYLVAYNPDAIDVGPTTSAPTWAHPMGTDEFGRSILARVLYGARISLSIGFVAVSLSASIGTAVGAVAGYFGGWVDRALMWLVDLLLSLPRLVLLLAIVGFFRAGGAHSIFVLVAILGATGWMAVARIVRSQVLSLKEQDFIQAGRALGASSGRLIAYHLIPNTLAPVIVFSSLAIGSTILVEASLSFLGLGVPPPTATWGSVVNAGRDYMRSAPWITIFPGILIVLAVMSFNLLGDGLRDALESKAPRSSLTARG